MQEGESAETSAAGPFRASRKPVLCLDTNYLSNLARARLGQGLSRAALEAWQSLLQSLTTAVWDDRLVCPGFNVQVEELRMDDRISGPAWVVLRSLSLGLSFHSLDGIFARQVEDVALSYIGAPDSGRLSWQHAFQADPDLPAVEVSRRAHASGMLAPFGDRLTRDDRLHCLGLSNGLPPDVSDAILNRPSTEGKLAFARLVLGNRLRGLLSGGAMSPSPMLDADTAEWLALVDRLQAAGMGPRKIVEFLGSGWPAHIPFVHLYCTLVRAAATGTHERLLQTSDEADRCIVAALLPYCTLLTTDRFVKHMLTTELHLDAQYGCQVYSGRLDDVRLLAQVVSILPAAG